MPRKETILSVFVASPSDVSDERKSLEEIISELNRTWSKSLNLRIELLKWETDIYPGFGDYPQDVINKQIDDNYDVFIAIFWSKIGSPTNESISGTVEEFERAYAKYKSNKESVDILVYFKDVAIPPSKLDPEQLIKLNQLKVEMGDKGGLYWSFDNIELFESLLRSHLSKVAQKWAEKVEKELLPDLTTDTKEKIDNLETDQTCEYDESDDYGLFDHVEIYEERMADHNAGLSVITEATERIGIQFTRRTEEINKLEKENGVVDRKQARRVIKSSSDDLERYSEIVNNQVSIVSSAREDAFEALSKALSLSVDFQKDTESILELEEGLDGMRNVLVGTKKGIINFRETMAAFPRLTLQLNKAKRRALQSVDSILKELDSTSISCTNILDIISEIKEADT